MNQPVLLMTFRDMGLEAWVKYDADSDLWEVFASKECDDYIGCADTKEECKAVARQWADEWMS